MNICSNKHEEICHEDRYCPICNEIDDLNEKIEDLKKEVESLEEELNEM